MVKDGGSIGRPDVIEYGPEDSGAVPPLPSVRLGSGTAWSLAMQVVTALTSIAIGVVVSRTLGPTGKGTLSIVQQVVAILMVVGDLGIGLAAIYYISRGEVRAGTVLGNAFVALTFVSAAAGVAMLILFRSPLAVVHLDWPFTVAAFALFLTGISMGWIGSIAVGLRGVKGLGVPSVLASLLTGVAVAVAWQVGARSAIAIVFASVFGVTVGIVVASISLIPWLRPIRVSASAFRLMRKYSAKLYVASAADYLHFRQDILMLGWIAGVGAAGVYSVGVSVAEIATRIPSAFGTAIQAQAPRLSHESALDVSARAIRLTVVASLVVLSGLSLVVGWLIPALFGEPFRGAVLVFYVLVPGAFANSLIWPISGYQSARGEVYWGLSSASVALNIALNMLLIGSFGYVGAAAASSVSYTVLVVLLVTRLRTSTGKSPAFFLVPTSEDIRVVANSARAYLGRS